MKLRKFVPLTMTALLVSAFAASCGSGDGSQTLSRDDFMSKYTSYASTRTTDLSSYYTVKAKGKIVQGQNILDFSTNGRDTLVDDDNEDKSLFAYLYSSIELPLGFKDGAKLDKYLSNLLPTGVKNDETFTTKNDVLTYEAKNVSLVFTNESIKNANIKLSFDKTGLVTDFSINGSFREVDLTISAAFSDYSTYSDISEDEFFSYYSGAISKRQRATNKYYDVKVYGVDEANENTYFDEAKDIIDFINGGYLINDNLSYDYACYVGFDTTDELREIIYNQRITKRTYGRTGENCVLSFEWKDSSEVAYRTDLYLNDIGYANHFVVYTNYLSTTSQKEIYIDLDDYQTETSYADLAAFANKYSELINGRSGGTLYGGYYAELGYTYNTGHEPEIKYIEGNAPIYISENDATKENDKIFKTPLGNKKLKSDRLGFTNKDTFQNYIKSFRDEMSGTITEEEYYSTRSSHVACLSSSKTEGGVTDEMHYHFTYNNDGILTSFVSNVVIKNTQTQSESHALDVIFADDYRYTTNDDITFEDFISKMNVDDKGYNTVEAKCSATNEIGQASQVTATSTLKNQNGQIEFNNAKLSVYPIKAGFTSEEALRTYLGTVQEAGSARFLENEDRGELMLQFPYESENPNISGSYTLVYGSDGLLKEASRIYSAYGSTDIEEAFEFYDYSNLD